jgi:prepilin-type N-terminal cleavage/methylation domain-containing protein
MMTGMNDVNNKLSIISYNGFTLIELLIALAISSLVLTAVYKVFISNNIIYLKQNEMTKIEQNIRSAMNMMNRDIRMAGYKDQNNTITGFNSTISNSTMIAFNYEDEVHSKKNVKYYFDSSQKRIENKDGYSIANNIGGLEFKYCNTRFRLLFNSYSQYHACYCFNNTIH